MSIAIPLLPFWAFMAGYRVKSTFTIYDCQIAEMVTDRAPQAVLISWLPLALQRHISKLPFAPPVHLARSCRLTHLPIHVPLLLIIPDGNIFTGYLASYLLT